MVKSFYIASGLNNISQVQALRDLLVKNGWVFTYDWTIAASKGDLREASDYDKELTAWNEINGVKTADVVIVLLPGGKGTHGELGGSVIMDKPVILYPGDRDEILKEGNFCVFYFHRNVVRITKLYNQEIVNNSILDTANRLFYNTHPCAS